MSITKGMNNMNGWISKDNKWYFYKNDVPVKGWYRFTTADGEKADHWSFFDKNTGIMYTGWHKMGNAEGETAEHWSYFGDNGWLRTGWQQMGKGTNNPDGNSPKHWSYFGKNGWLRTGWCKLTQKDDNEQVDHWSYFGSNGWLRTRWVLFGKGTSEPDGNSKQHWSFFGNNGWLYTGLVKLTENDGEKPHLSYFDERGWLVTKTTVKVDGKTYKADSRGWLTESGDTPTPTPNIMTQTKFLAWALGKYLDYDKMYGVQCFTKDHYVNMADGTYKAIQDIEIGDRVLDINNKEVSVTKTFKHTAPVFKVKTNLTEFEVTEDHPFLYDDDSFSSIFDIGEKTPKLYDKTNSEESGLTDNELRFLGVWLGDGSLIRYKDGRSWDARITYGDSKADYVNSLEILSNTVNRKDSVGSKDGSFRKSDHPKLIEHIYKCYDEYNQKQLPLIYTNREYELILDGYLHADGYERVCDSFHCWQVSSTSKKLLSSIQAICIVLGYATCSIRRKTRTEDTITIRGKEVRNVKPIYVMQIRKDGKANHPKIVDSEYIGEQTVYNIEVDGSHTYICNNYKVHNCVDLIKYDLDMVFDVTPGSWGNAHAYYDNYNSLPLLVKHFTRIPNTPSFVPQKGDIVIWKKALNGLYGHIAIADGVGNTDYFYSYDQNWTGHNDKCTRIRHNYDYVAGVLRPKDKSKI